MFVDIIAFPGFNDWSIAIARERSKCQFLQVMTGGQEHLRYRSQVCVLEIIAIPIFQFFLFCQRKANHVQQKRRRGSTPI
jgi:hypothetical protein